MRYANNYYDGHTYFNGMGLDGDGEWRTNHWSTKITQQYINKVIMVD